MGQLRRTKTSGTLTERSPGVWRLRVYVGDRARTGTPVQRSRTFQGTEKDALKALARFVTDVDDQRFDRTAATVGQLLDRWLDTIEQTRSLSTIRDYRGAVDHVIRPAIGAKRLSALRTDELDSWYRFWLTEEVVPATDDRPARARSRTTVLKYHHIIAAACAQAVKWGWIEKNPAKLATPPRASSPEMTVPSAETLQEVVRRAEETRPVLGTVVALAALTGMRRGELCALRWSEVTEEAIVVSHSLTVVGGELHVGDTKTHARRVIALDDLGRAILARRRRAAVETAAQAGTEMDPDGFVLSERADSARPILPDTLSHWFGDLMASMELPYHLHQLRHFTATTALGAGVDVRTVAGRLGHRDASTTLRIYAHAQVAQDRRAAAVLGRALTPKKPRSRARKALER